MINSPLSHLLGSQLAREIGDPIADLSSLVLDRQNERKWTFRAETPTYGRFLIAGLRS